MAAKIKFVLFGSVDSGKNEYLEKHMENMKARGLVNDEKIVLETGQRKIIGDNQHVILPITSKSGETAEIGLYYFSAAASERLRTSRKIMLDGTDILIFFLEDNPEYFDRYTYLFDEIKKKEGLDCYFVLSRSTMKMTLEQTLHKLVNSGLVKNIQQAMMCTYELEASSTSEVVSRIFTLILRSHIQKRLEQLRDPEPDDPLLLQFEGIYQRTERLKLSILSSLLEMDEKELYQWLYKLPSKYEFKIDQDIICFTIDLSSEIDDLLFQYNQMEELGMGKKV
ncbi:MAG: hypothetical protein INQ03_02705 [Candidatus Heimdallarchaeota archaeon]|nr:hypothetical protein [Candidatus Heimdallarchaeota archaeon]